MSINNKKQEELIEAAKSGRISEMYPLIASGANPFYFDKNGQTPLNHAIVSDPIKTHILLLDLHEATTSPAKKDILNHYIELSIKSGGRNED
jgi:ankyrin repeat protein